MYYYHHYHFCHSEPSRACQPLTPPPMKSDGRPNNAIAPLRFRHTGKFARLSKHETPASLMAHPLALSKPGLSNHPTEPNECSKRNARTKLTHFGHMSNSFLLSETLQRKTSVLAKHSDSGVSPAKPCGRFDARQTGARVLRVCMHSTNV